MCGRTLEQPNDPNAAPRDDLVTDEIRAAFDGLLEQMQTPAAREATSRALRATSEEMGRAVADAARQHDRKAP